MGPGDLLWPGSGCNQVEAVVRSGARHLLGLAGWPPVHSPVDFLAVLEGGP
ncbi:MAG: hypothetical protein ACYCTZ_10820 [Candidatus Dormibacteria bacterium]